MSKNHDDDQQYLQRADEMDRQYLEAWQRMTPEMRAKLKEKGIEGPELNDHHSEQGSRDVSEFVELANPEPTLITEAEMVAALLCSTREDEIADAFADHFRIPRETTKRMVGWIMDGIEREVNRRHAETLKMAVGIILVENNVKVSVMGLAFALDFPELEAMGYTSMRAAAPAIGCSASHLSKHANRWADLLGLPRPSTMKSAEAREKYSDERSRNHWRNQVCQTK